MREHLRPSPFARLWAESAWMFRGLTDNLDQCVYVLDRDGRCLDANDSFCRWLKRPRSEILDRPVADFWPSPAAEREAGEHARVLHGEEIETEEERPRGRHTSRVRLRKTPLRDAEGNVCGVLCLFREVVAEPAPLAPPQVGGAGGGGRQASRMELLGRLTSGVLHDLRNLLTLLGTPLSLLQEKLPAGRGEAELATMRNAVKQGSTLAERLLRLARGDSSEIRPLDVNASCAEAIELLQHNLAPRITLQARLQPGLPPVLAEAGEMVQVLLNLCLNACDAMPHGGQLLLETALGNIGRGKSGGAEPPRTGDFICLQVRDTGEGISPEVRASVFEEMFTTKTVGRNCGLGLAIVRDIVQKRGGSIECESSPGAGTCFTVWLPSASTHPDSTPAPSFPSLVGKTILVIEPDPNILLLATTVLMQQGFRVLSRTEARQAVELSRQELGGIDLVVVEENPPGQSEREVTNELLAINPRLAFVLVSAAKTPAKSPPADSSKRVLLNKPYTAEQLRQCVDAALSQG